MNPHNPEIAVDQERLDAEAAALALRLRLNGVQPGSSGALKASQEIQALSDPELRLELHQLRTKDRALTAAAAEHPARQVALKELARRYGQAFGELPKAADFEAVLEERFDLKVGADGLLEAGRIDARLSWVGEMPFALFHHTSSALLASMRQEGLRIGQPTNFFNTQAGVYVSTIASGSPVAVYSARAARVHGGEPITLRVRRRISDLTPDPDDADLAWAQGRQFITPSVPANVIVWDDAVPAAAPVPTTARPLRPRGPGR
ncbi:hypothetical protein [Paucibacter soli]|uniref:hypothetical protein n=1 Tax=Paucibacter soli TaxID=3133433 RepID=UPI0030A767A6